MKPTIESAPQLYGRIDGDMHARLCRQQDAVGAFNRRLVLSRLDESERAEYAESYNDAYELECRLQLAGMEVA